VNVLSPNRISMVGSRWCSKAESQASFTPRYRQFHRRSAWSSQGLQGLRRIFRYWFVGGIETPVVSNPWGWVASRRIVQPQRVWVWRCGWTLKVDKMGFSLCVKLFMHLKLFCEIFKCGLLIFSCTICQREIVSLGLFAKVSIRFVHLGQHKHKTFRKSWYDS